MKYLMGRKMSKKATFELYEFYGDWYYELTGSANDILKGIKEAEIMGYGPLYPNPPILRTGRTYILTLDSTTHTWFVDRAV